MFNLYEDAGNRVIRSLRRRIVWTGQYQLPDSVLLVAAACGRGSGIFQPVCLVFAFTRCTMRLFIFLFGVCLCTYSPYSRWVFAGLLLAGRGICLIFLFWFLLRRFQVGGRSLSQDLAVACCFSGATILVFHWLLSPVVAELSQSFILT